MQHHKRPPTATSGDDDILDDPLIKGSDSPALERYRLARAKMAERQLEEIQGHIIPRDKLRPALLQLAMILRRAGEIMQRSHGPGPAMLLDEALTEAEKSIAEMFPNTDDQD